MPNHLRRSNPFDGFVPTDFVDPTPGPDGVPGSWPDGPFRLPHPPQRLAELGMDTAAQQLLLASVAELAKQVAEYRRWRRGRHLKQAAVARRISVRPARLSALENGRRWPAWDLLILLSLIRGDDQER